MIDVTKLTDYVEERRLPLIAKAVLGAKTLQYVNIQTDVKYKAALNLLSADPELQAGGCGFEDQGSVTLSQRIITAPLVKVNMSFCDKDLLKKWTGYEVRVAAGFEKLPFEEEFTNEIVKNLNAKIEKAIWQGDETLGIEGFGSFDSEYTSVAAAADAKAAIDAVYAALPAEVIDDAVIFVGEDTYRAYITALVNANLYHFKPEYDGGEYTLPGSNVRVISVNGLNGTKKVYGGSLKNFFVGVDMENDQERFDLWYSKDHQEFRLAINFNIGAQVAWPDQIVVGSYA